MAKDGREASASSRPFGAMEGDNAVSLSLDRIEGETEERALLYTVKPNGENVRGDKDGRVWDLPSGEELPSGPAPEGCSRREWVRRKGRSKEA